LYDTLYPGFSLPNGAIVTGFRVSVSRYMYHSNDGQGWETHAQLSVEGVAIGDQKATGAEVLPSPGSVAFGGEGDLWGIDWEEARGAHSLNEFLDAFLDFDYGATIQGIADGIVIRVPSIYRTVYWTVEGMKFDGVTSIKFNNVAEKFDGV
jgi:hypothetical protein